MDRTYEFSAVVTPLNAALALQPPMPTTASLTLRVARSTVVALIAGASSRSLPRQSAEPSVFDGSESYDPDDEEGGGSGQPLEYSWGCEGPPGTYTCFALVYLKAIYLFGDEFISLTGTYIRNDLRPSDNATSRHSLIHITIMASFRFSRCL